MFCTRRKSRRNGDTRSVRVPFKPSLEYLEERLTPTQTFNPVDTAGLINALQAADAAPNDTTIINLQAGTTYTLTTINNYWYGPDGLPPIESNVVLHGNGAVIQRDTSAGTSDFRLFYVSGGLELPLGSLTMDNVTLQGGLAKGGDSGAGGGGLGAGGAVFNQGTLSLTNVTLANNQALGGSSGVMGAGAGGGGMGQDAQGFSGGGFGGDLGGSFGGAGGNGLATGAAGGGGGGGFVTGANGNNGSAASGAFGGGNGGFAAGGSSDGGSGGFAPSGGSGNGGSFGVGGFAPGGGGGVGGGGAADNVGGGGGFGGGGAVGVNGASGGFGGGGGGGLGPTGGGGGVGGSAGFGGGIGSGFTGGGGAGMGGAIFNMGADSAHDGSGQATLINCTLAGNSAVGGNASGSSPTGNGGSGLGGAVFNLDGQVTLTSTTLARNDVSGGSSDNGTAGIADGGTVYNLAFGNEINTGSQVAAKLVLNNSILAKTNGGHRDLVSLASNGNSTNTAAVSGSHNLVMTSSGTIGPGVITLTADPFLGLLQNNGGLTPTLLPESDSPFLGAGDPSLAPTTDQRGLSRPPGGPTDLGSVQVSVAPTSPPAAPPPSPSGGGGTQTPPSLFQAVLSLYLDGVAAELENLAQEFAGNIDEFPLDTSASDAKAAAAGFNYSAILSLSDAVFRFTGHSSSTALADIQHNLPYAGPFGLPAVQAGVQGADQAAHL